MKRTLITTLLLVGIWFTSLTAKTIYVDDNTKGQGRGTITNPYRKIKTAIVNANNGDTILVMAGTYNETIDFLGKAITVESKDGPGTTIIDGTGLGQVSVVSFKNNEKGDSILKGFTVRGGRGSLQMFNGAQMLIGGGIVCVKASPTISDVELSGNSSSWGGGIAGIDGSNCLMTKVVFTNNSAAVNGGGAVFMGNCKPSFLDCTFNQNTALHTGGAINVRESIPFISRCDFNGNSGTDMGGAIRIGALSDAMLDYCRFYNNTSSFGGGLAAGSDTLGITGSVSITNSIFDGNSSPNGSELSINGIYPAEIHISYSYVLGGDTQSSVFVDTKWDRYTYLDWGPGMNDNPDTLQSHLQKSAVGSFEKEELPVVECGNGAL